MHRLTKIYPICSLNSFGRTSQHLLWPMVAQVSGVIYQVTSLLSSLSVKNKEPTASSTPASVRGKWGTSKHNKKASIVESMTAGEEATEGWFKSIDHEDVPILSGQRMGTFILTLRFSFPNRNG